MTGRAHPLVMVTCQDCKGKGTNDGKRACDKCNGYGKVLGESWQARLDNRRMA